MLILDDWKALARYCRKLREDAGLSQQDLADAIGEKNPQQISNAESELQPSRQSIRKRILEHFGYEVNDAFTVTEVRNK